MSKSFVFRKLDAYRVLSLAIAVGCLGLVWVAQSRADTLSDADPSTLHIGAGAGTVCATGCGGHPNLIGTGSGVDIYQNSSGAPNLSQPLLLILGVPNHAPSPSIGGSVTL